MGLIDKIGGKGLVAGAMLGAGVLCSGCMSDYGNSFGRSLVETGMRQAVVSGVQNEVEGPRGTTVNVGQKAVREYERLNFDDKATLREIKKMPRVLCLGDVNKDGKTDWAYYDGKGKRYLANIIFRDEKGDYLFEKKGSYTRGEFIYANKETKTVHKVPKNALIIWYKNPALNLD